MGEIDRYVYFGSEPPLSPHYPAILATTSDDGTTRIWDALSSNLSDGVQRQGGGRSGGRGRIACLAVLDMRFVSVATALLRWYVGDDGL